MRKESKFTEWLSVQLAKNPSRIILVAILVFNIVFFLIAAEVISLLSLSGTEHMGFIEAAFCTVTMILDPGCISYVVEDIGNVGVAITIACLIVIVVGMVFFTGTVIGYITNYLSDFIASVNSGEHKLYMSDHVVVLNWNMKGAEIINEMLFSEKKQNVVVLVSENKVGIQKEIKERMLSTIERNNLELLEECSGKSALQKYLFIRKNGLKQNITVIVREGDVFSTKQLNDISLKQAKVVYILEENLRNHASKSIKLEREKENSRGNPQTIKTLMQVADITDAFDSNDNQKVLVEVTDRWTSDLVDKIVRYKHVEGKSKIIQLPVNAILGRLISQFTVMPDLNLVYRELFSNRGATVFSVEEKQETDIRDYIKSHRFSLPLTSMEANGERNFYYISDKENAIRKTDTKTEPLDYKVDLNEDYWIENKNVIILGHNSKICSIMQGFSAFRRMWNYKGGGEILKVVVIDDEKSLEKMNFYEEYPFVIHTVAASVYDKELIAETIDYFVDKTEDNTKILILSDDEALDEDIDAKALANLIYVQELKNEREIRDPENEEGRIDVIVEINDPKHNDIVRGYNVDNVVISNRYISKIIGQIGEKETMYNFYSDLLTYNEKTLDKYVSKEIYTKKVSGVFNTIPEKTTADKFIRAMYEASADENIPEELRNPMIALGYVKPGGKMTLFSGNQKEIEVEIEERDKIVLFSNH